MPAIFVSYRPQDQPDWLLSQVRARVQKDIAVDWVEAGGSLESCQMVLVMIGPQWLSAADVDGRLLIQDPQDPVHVTLKRALERGLRLVPVLLDGTTMPRSHELPTEFQALVRRPAMSLHPQRLDADMGMLVSMIRRTLESSFGSVVASSVSAHAKSEAQSTFSPPPAPAAPPPVVTPAPVAPTSRSPNTLRGLPEPEELPELAHLFAPPPPPPPPPVTVAPVGVPPVAPPETPPQPTVVPQAMASVRPPTVSSADRRDRRRMKQLQKRRTILVRFGLGLGAFVLLLGLAWLGWALLHRLIRSEPSPTAQAAEVVKAAESAVVLTSVPAASAKSADALPPLTPGQSFRDCEAPACPLMVVLPAGHFSMGSSAPGMGAYDDERPAHEVTVRKVALGRFEVTFQEWEACFQDKDCSHWPSDEGWGRETRPVINVSWEDVQRYLKWLSQKTGHVYRLPTEAEWEYGARAGTTTNYSFGNDEKGLNDYAWYSGNSGNQSHPVGEKKPNAFGLYDIHGSVWEWVQDCWHPNYQGAPTTGAAWDTDCRGGNRRTVRGGGWNDTARVVRSTYRYGYLSDGRSLSQGFRVARELSP
ncbi:formylglycine-generating enzyme family protein [Leptothrix ochracea]|uniref:formylglycine-generating enzyme family protein n=1 Tax=Leptothrix ochracea TaxID=735331 RepID=UPI0034E2DEB5